MYVPSHMLQPGIGQTLTIGGYTGVVTHTTCKTRTFSEFPVMEITLETQGSRAEVVGKDVGGRGRANQPFNPSFFVREGITLNREYRDAVDSTGVVVARSYYNENWSNAVPDVGVEPVQAEGSQEEVPQDFLKDKPKPTRRGRRIKLT